MHNSREEIYRYPFGAVRTGESVTLRIRADIRSCVKLIVWTDEMKVCDGARVGDMYEFNITMPDKPMLVWYCFKVDDKYYCGRSGEGYISDSITESYQITVYDKSFETPEWFRNSVMYQIFPDRFNIGHDSIPNIKSHTERGQTATLHERFDEEVMSLPFIDKEHYEPCDFFGGDIQGIIDKAEYLKDLGISCIYLNPIFSSPSNHRYDTSDYMNVDRILGTNEDVTRLSNTGLKIILDGVFSHTGDDSIYFDRYGRFSSGKPYEWYEKDSSGRYKYWWGFTSLPEVDEDNEEYRAFIKKVVSFWAKHGVNGWRLDVADELTDGFIEMFRAHLKSISKENVLIGEVWENATNKISKGHRRSYCDGFSLDSVMNYPLLELIHDFITYKISAGDFASKTMELIESYPKPMLYALMNILSTHDTERSLTRLGSVERQKAASTIQFAMAGVPCIYYGDEAGLEGGKDPFNRRPYPYGRENRELINHYKMLGRARNSIAELRSGSCHIASYGDDVIIILRGSVICAVNRSDREIPVIIDEKLFKEGENVEKIKLNGRYVNVFTNDKFVCYNKLIILKPFESVIMEREKCSEDCLTEDMDLTS